MTSDIYHGQDSLRQQVGLKRPSRGPRLWHGARVGVHFKTTPRLEKLRDFAFAVGFIIMISDLRVPGTHFPLFLLAVAGLVVLNYPHLYEINRTPRFFVWPLFAFLGQYLWSAHTHNTFKIFFPQTMIDLAFTYIFVMRYSVVPMRQLFRYSGFLLFLFTLYVVGWHIRKHHFVSYKFLPNCKAVFDYLPLMLMALKLSDSKAAKRTLIFMGPILAAIILASGERKAYITLFMMTPFLVNWRSPLAYVLPLVALLLLPVVVAVDPSGYIARQITGLGQLATGHVTHTISNDDRAFAISYAKQLFSEHPATGVGTGMFTINMILTYHQYLGTHNEWLRVTAENGVIGVTLYGLTVLLGFIGLFRKTSWGVTRTSKERIMAFWVFAVLLMYISFEAIDFIVFLSFLMIPYLSHLRLDPNRTATVKPLVAQPIGWKSTMRLHERKAAAKAHRSGLEAPSPQSHP